MLTADLVDVRRKDGALFLRPIDAKHRGEALELAAGFLDTAKEYVGKKREELDEAWAAIGDSASRPKLAAGLRKLAEDACGFESDDALSPTDVRRAVFMRASEVRRTRGPEEPWDRAAILDEVARSLGTTPLEIERALFADLRGEHVLRAAPTIDAATLVESWEMGQAQAVLLTAVKVTIDIASASPGLLRAFFAKLKFHQLLFSATRTEEGWSIVIDGPYSMFDAVTKYGLKLALVLPALRTLESWKLVAELRWGKEREPLTFRAEGDAKPAAHDEKLHVSDDVAELAKGIDATKSGWKASPTTAILDVPGMGVCIPDLEVVKGKGKEKTKVFVEVLGFWSRDAVWKRVELATKGLGAPVVFAVSARLRVSADVLGDDVPSALYVYKGKMSPKAVIERVEKLGRTST